MTESTAPDVQIAIRPLAEDEAEPCARMMERSEPWLTLGTAQRTLLEVMRNPSRERYVAATGRQLAGLVVVNMAGPLSGYIQAICVAPQCRAQGVGRRLMEYAEARIFRHVPNVFLFVSDFNLQARRFYERLGYLRVGEIPDYLVPGRTEILMRKTCGPISGYRS